MAGLESILKRRHSTMERIKPDLLKGPGKVSQALGLDMSYNSHPLYHKGGLELRVGEAPSGIMAGPRIGIDYAEPDHKMAPLRFGILDSPWVSDPMKMLWV